MTLCPVVATSAHELSHDASGTGNGSMTAGLEQANASHARNIMLATLFSRMWSSKRPRTDCQAPNATFSGNPIGSAGARAIHLGSGIGQEQRCGYRLPRTAAAGVVRQHQSPCAMTRLDIRAVQAM